MERAGPPKPVFWIASSLEDMRGLSQPVRETFGFALFQAQHGGKHASAKPLKGFDGAGVLEVVEEDQAGTYRAVYTVQFAAAVYVLHVFQKKSRKGARTPRPDVELVERRLSAARTHYRQWIRTHEEK